MSHTAHENLRHIATEWPALRELLQARTPAAWPPVMGLDRLEREPDDEQLAEAAAEHAERTASAPGERPAPLRVGVLDTITELEEELLGLADEIASACQRPAFTVRAASPVDEVARSIALMGARDQADGRRWRFNMARRTGATAAAWLADRLEGADGPHRALTGAEVRRIATIAASCRLRLDAALGQAEQDGAAQPLGRACACGGMLELISELDDFRIRCTSCGTGWTGTSLLARLFAV